MAAKQSAGLLVYRQADGQVEVLLGHMGGPFWARKDEGAWSIPKGEYTAGETPEAAARREFTEELGLPVPAGPLRELGTVKQSGGKTVTAWALEGDLDPETITPGTYEQEWPPRSGRIQQFPEIDRAAWFSLDTARTKLVKAQQGFIDRLADMVAGS